MRLLSSVLDNAGQFMLILLNYDEQRPFLYDSDGR